MKFDQEVKSTCSGEIQGMCSAVDFGFSAVRNCLNENLEARAMGPRCRRLLYDRIWRNQLHWGVDAALQESCKPATAKLCVGVVSHATTPEAAMIPCLVDHADKLEGGCRKQLSRAVREAFQLYKRYQRGREPLWTSCCDDDLKRVCPAVGREITPERCLKPHEKVIQNKRCALAVTLLEAAEPRESKEFTKVAAKLDSLESAMQNVPGMQDRIADLSDLLTHASSSTQAQLLETIKAYQAVTSDRLAMLLAAVVGVAVVGIGAICSPRRVPGAHHNPPPFALTRRGDPLQACGCISSTAYVRTRGT